MKAFLALALLSSSVSFAADFESIDTRIQEIIEPARGGASYSVLSTVDGRVYEADAQDAKLIENLRSFSPETPVHLMLVEDRIVGVTEMNAENAAEYGDLLLERAPKHRFFSEKATGTEGYQPTELATIAETSRLFDSLEGLRFKSQCYQRAQLWTYQMWRERGIKSMKVFLFFTRKHIREFSYKWWFHVAPFVHAGGTEIVLDPTFTQKPLAMREWTDSFMENHAFCPEALTYTAYENNQESQHCYVVKMPMYYYQPADIEAFELERRPTTGWQSGQLEHAKGARCRFPRRC